MEIAIYIIITKEKKDRYATCGGTISYNLVGKALSVVIRVQTLLMALEFAMIHGNLETSKKYVTLGTMESELQAAITNMNASISIGKDRTTVGVVLAQEST